MARAVLLIPWLVLSITACSDDPGPGVFRVGVLQTGNGFGIITSVPPGIDCGVDCDDMFEEGTTVTLTAVPDGSARFTGWTVGACTGTDPCVVEVTADVTFTANFMLR